MGRPWNTPMEEMSFANDREKLQETLARELETRSDQTRELIDGWAKSAGKNGWHESTAAAIHAIVIKAQVYQDIAWELRRDRLCREEAEAYIAQGSPSPAKEIES